MAITWTSGLSSATLFAAALVLSGRAHADPLPAPSGFVSAFSAPGMGQTDSGSGKLSVTSNTVGLTMFGTPFSASADAREFITPTPALDVAIAGANLITPGDPGASASLFYQFLVVAPVGASSSTMVPVFVKYSIATDFSPGATFQVEGLVQLESVATGSDSTICALSSFSSTSCFSTEVPSGPLRFGKTIEFQPGVVEDVGLNAAISFVSSQSSFDGDVIIDPTFTIDPAFLELNPGYSLQFSLGIGDSSTAVPTPVPEPATWTMMLLGFGGLGAAMSVARHSRGFRRSALGSAVVTKY